MNPHTVPLLRLSIPFIAGLALGGTLNISLPGLGIFLCIALLPAIWLAVRKSAYRQRWWFGAGVQLLLFAFGYYHITDFDESRNPEHFSHKTGGQGYFIAEVYQAPSKGMRLKVPVELAWAGPGPESLQKVRGRVMLFLPINDTTARIRYGDRLGFRGSLLPVEGPKNPHAFDYRAYLHFQNIHYQAFIGTDSVTQLSTGHGSLLWRSAYDCRDKLLNLMRRYFPTQEEYAVACALLLGYTDDLGDDLRAAYIDTGSMHALAVSGSHIGVLYAGLMLLIKRLRLRGRKGRLLETALVLSAIWAFTFLSGATASVLRASVMFSVYLTGKALWRESSAWNVLPASAFILLLIDPYLLFNPGFQLSYGAVAGMVFFYPRFYKMFPPTARWADELLKVFLVGVSAQLGTLPLSLFYFHQFPLLFWLTGWVVVFVGAVFLWGGALLVLLDGLVQPFADALGYLLFRMLYLMDQFILLVQGVPGAVLRNIWIPVWATPLLYLCLVFLGAALATRRGIWLGAMVLLMSALGLYRVHFLEEKRAQENLIVYFVNKARLVDFFEGDKALVLSDSLSGKQEKMAAEGNRIASAIRSVDKRLLQNPLNYQDKHLMIDWPFIQFYRKRLIMIDEVRWVANTRPAPLRVDAIVLSRSPKLSIAACLKRFPASIVVFDASNSARRTRRWIEECKTLGQPYHDVRSMGAWQGFESS